MKELEKELNNYTVLIAEDDEIIRNKLVTILNFYFKEVYYCDNGYDAYEIFLEEKPSLVISDIEMANANGINLVKDIRVLDENTPIIILSAYSKEEYLLELINLKIDQYILKPATNKKLFDAISTALLKEQINNIKLAEDMYLNLDSNMLYYKKEEIILRKKEKYFLELLAKNNHKTTTYELIEEYIWVEKIMTQNALKTFIKELRRKLPIHIIENVMQEGYKLKEF